MTLDGQRSYIEQRQAGVRAFSAEMREASEGFADALDVSARRNDPWRGDISLGDGGRATDRRVSARR